MAKILIHSIVFRPDGVSTAYLYADLVSELKKYGHEIVVLTSTPHYNLVESDIALQPLTKRRLGLYYTSEYDGIKVYHVPMRKARRTFFRILDFVKFHILSICIGGTLGKFDIVLAPSPPLTIGFVAYVIAKITGGKSIYNVQEIYPDFAINQGIFKNNQIINVLKWAEKFIYKKSAAVVVIDQKFADIIAPRVDTLEKLFVIPNFVDSNLYKPGPRQNDFSDKHNLNDKFVIAYAGNIGFAQSWESLIAAAKELSQMPVQFMIVGNGIRKEWLESEIISNDIKNILLLDYQPRDLMPLINVSADIHTILMSPEMDGEGFPSKIYTIMSSAKSVIISTGKNSPLSNLMNKANYGRVVPLNDKESYIQAIIQAYKDRDILHVEGARARKFIELNFSKEAISQQYHNLIEQIVSKNRQK